MRSPHAVVGGRRSGFPVCRGTASQPSRRAETHPGPITPRSPWLHCFLARKLLASMPLRAGPDGAQRPCCQTVISGIVRQTSSRRQASRLPNSLKPAFPRRGFHNSNFPAARGPSRPQRFDDSSGHRLHLPVDPRLQRDFPTAILEILCTGAPVCPVPHLQMISRADQCHGLLRSRSLQKLVGQ
jgi:hypothetical protein